MYQNTNLKNWSKLQCIWPKLLTKFVNFLEIFFLLFSDIHSNIVK
jgi:hypothetical protein